MQRESYNSPLPQITHTLLNYNYPKISVIIPVYNSEKYLEKTLNSVLNQTFGNIEIICVDDCSTDNSLSILERFQKEDSRIKIIRNSKNSGVAFSRNIALNNSSTDYIMFLDSDDRYKLNMCEKMYNEILLNKSSVVCNAEVVFDKSVPKDDKYKKERNYADKNSRMLWNKIFLKKNIDKLDLDFPLGLRGGSDAPFTVAYMNIIENTGIINDKLYEYTRRNDSITGSVGNQKDNEKMFDCFKVSDSIYENFKKNNKLISSEAYNLYFGNINFGISQFTEKNYEKIANIIFESIKNKPEIEIKEDCFIVMNKKYKINNEVFSIVRKKYLEEEKRKENVNNRHYVKKFKDSGIYQ